MTLEKSGFPERCSWTVASGDTVSQKMWRFLRGAKMFEFIKINMRVGNGYDVHKFSERRKFLNRRSENFLWRREAWKPLGRKCGSIRYYRCPIRSRSFKGYRIQFLDTDLEYKEVYSLEILKKVGEMLEENLYLIDNIDAIIVTKRKRTLALIWIRCR